VSSADCLGNSRMNCTVCQAPVDVVLSKVNVHPCQVDTVFITKQLVLPQADCKREVKPEEGSSCLYRASTVLRHYFITPN